jgi:hypothetical protein
VALGYNDIDFFDKMRNPEGLEMDAILTSKTLDEGSF